MEQQVLGDENLYPTKEVIYANIENSKILWETLFEHIHANHPDLNTQWRYYKDGKSWLMKVTRKSKTIFWLSLVEDTFRTTFYFTDRAEEAIKNSPLPEALKDQFTNGKRYSKIRGLTVTFANKEDVENAKYLIALKLSIK